MVQNSIDYEFENEAHEFENEAHEFENISAELKNLNVELNTIINEAKNTSIENIISLTNAIQHED
jgi:hypothetical protein